MVDFEKLRESARNTAAAEIFSYMASEEKSKKRLEQIHALPDAMLDFMAKQAGVPEEQFHIHRAMIRGEDNIFMDGLGKVDGLLQPGDVILMTGNSHGSQALVQIQKRLGKLARSSHVALVHADFICIDAMPKTGTSNRVISDVLTNVEPDWRVIRCRSVQSEHRDTIMRACAFYLAQPYKIFPSKISMNRFTYCSELARKVYSHCGITGIGIPNNSIIMPADFDRLADGHSHWLDVTEAVRPAIDFYSKYPELVKIAGKLFIDGLKLNRQRFKERTALLPAIKKAAKAGKISREKALEMTRTIKEMESNLNHTFWDVQRKD